MDSFFIQTSCSLIMVSTEMEKANIFSRIFAFLMWKRKIAENCTNIKTFYKTSHLLFRKNFRIFCFIFFTKFRIVFPTFRKTNFMRNFSKKFAKYERKFLRKFWFVGNPMSQQFEVFIGNHVNLWSNDKYKYPHEICI